MIGIFDGDQMAHILRLIAVAAVVLPVLALGLWLGFCAMLRRRFG